MTFSESLLAWYGQNKRAFPWRGSSDPYVIWLSEIMLQQTRTETVIPYFERFTRRFPTVFDLASAQEDEVLKLWEGLGYYSRARNLHKTAQCVAAEHCGRFPQTPDALRKLPGIGPYAANAISSIAFGACVPALDGNQARILSRVFAWEAPLRTPFDLNEQALQCMPSENSGDYNQALMDLGASICTPKNPRCGDCPVSAFCLAYQNGDVERYPLKNPPPLKQELDYCIILALYKGSVLVRRRASKGLLGGLYEFIQLDLHPGRKALVTELEEKGFGAVRYVRELPPAKHVFTHLIWRMQGHLVEVSHVPEGYAAADAAQLQALAFPTAIRKYREIAEELLAR